MTVTHSRTHTHARKTRFGLWPRASRTTHNNPVTSPADPGHVLTAKCIKLKKSAEKLHVFRKKVVTLPTKSTNSNMNSRTNPQEKPVEVLSFRRGIDVATVVTDGDQTRTFERDCNKAHPTLAKAISYLEAKGYLIQPDEFA